MGLHQRLSRLERLRPVGTAPGVVFIDDRGHVLDEGSAATLSWVGQHYSAVPGSHTIVGGVDPLAALGRTMAGGPGEQLSGSASTGLANARDASSLPDG